MTESSTDDRLPQSRRTAEEWLQLVLTLITSSRSMADLGVESVRQTTGLALEEYDDGQFGSAEQLSPDWNVRLTKDEEDGFDPRLEFGFFPVSDDRAATDVLARLDFDTFARTLVEAGFEQQLTYGEHGQIRDRRFTRDQLRVTVLTRADTAKAPDQPRHDLVDTVILR